MENRGAKFFALTSNARRFSSVGWGHVRGRGCLLSHQNHRPRDFRAAAAALDRRHRCLPKLRADVKIGIFAILKSLSYGLDGDANGELKTMPLICTGHLPN